MIAFGANGRNRESVGEIVVAARSAAMADQKTSF
jgi:hypothetical protein